MDGNLNVTTDLLPNADSHTLIASYRLADERWRAILMSLCRLRSMPYVNPRPWLPES
jgi:hypothetical protein